MTGDESAPGASKIGVVGGVSLVAGSMLGVGILLTPPIVAGAVGSAGAYYGMWLLGGLVALCGALIYAELGAARPRAGGDYVFQRAAFGPSVAFASGVVMFALAFAGSIATMGAALFEYQVATLLPAAGIPISPAAVQVGGLGLHQLGAIGLVGLLTLVNLGGVRLGAGVQAALTILPFLAQGCLALVGIWRGGEGALLLEAHPGGSSIATAFLGVYFAYSGWGAVVYVAGEVRRPARTLPASLLGGTALTMILYLLLCAAFLAVLGPGLPGAGEAGTALALALLGPRGGILMAGLVALSITACMNGTILGGARVAAGMAEDGALPRFLAVRSATGVPARALLVQAGLAALLLLTGGFETILSITSVAMMVIGTLTVISAGVLRRRGEVGPFRSPLWPLPAAIYIGVSAVVVGAMVFDATGEGAILPLLGLPALLLAYVGHRLWRRGR